MQHNHFGAKRPLVRGDAHRVTPARYTRLSSGLLSLTTKKLEKKPSRPSFATKKTRATSSPSLRQLLSHPRPACRSITAPLAQNRSIQCFQNASSISSVKQAIMKSAAACDWNPRQHRYDLLGAASRLATAALLPPLAHEALSLGYELDCFVQEPESREAQTQKLTQPIHRQFTSLHRRRRCRLAGLTPLTWHYFTSIYLQYQTFVRMFDKCGPCAVLGKHGNQAGCFGRVKDPFSTSRKAA